MLPEPDNLGIHWVKSPAKLNLFLHILGKQSDGYHQLQSLFQLLDFGDDIGAKLLLNSKIEIKTPLPNLLEKDNLAYKAAELLKDAANVQYGCELHLIKKLPMGGGIGGGSSNAASVLLLLNELWQCNLSLDQLAKLGLVLGADVPIFVFGQTAFANGIGEKLAKCPQPPKWYLVATPNLHISTRDVFTHPLLKRDTQPISISDYCFENTRNDCETLVAKLHPQVANLLQWLVNYAPARMTGTGASVFGVFDSEDKAHYALSNLPRECKGFVSLGVNLSPLHSQLKLYN